MNETAADELRCLAESVRALEVQVKDADTLPSLVLAQIAVDAARMSRRLRKLGASLDGKRPTG
jgi:hypothetical protein